jgi:DNA polymerase I-like protein with 3'-5' exonuclease and polymerase domains
LITDVEGLGALSNFLDRHETRVIGIDTETNVVDNFISRRIRTIQVGDRNEQYVIDLLPFAGSTEELTNGQGRRSCASWAKPVVEVLRPVLDSKEFLKIGVNLQYEYTVFLWCLGLHSWNFYDCAVVEKVIKAGTAGLFAQSMEMMFERYTGFQINKSLQKSFDLHNPLTDEQIAYAAFDTRAPFAIRAGQNGGPRSPVQAYGLQRTVDVENHVIPAFSDLHLNGIRYSREKVLEFIANSQRKHVENVARLDSFFIPVVGNKNDPPKVDLEALQFSWREASSKATAARTAWKKHPDDTTAAALEVAVADREKYKAAYYEAQRTASAWKKKLPTCEGEALINYGSPDQLLAALKLMGFSAKQLPNTNDRTLEKLAADHPVLAALQDFRSSNKLLDQYGMGFLEHINPETGLVHSHFEQQGTQTGRSSSARPNVQNQPIDLRLCVIPTEDDEALVVRDMSGAELRILAEIAEDPVWLGAFNRREDVHSVGAAMLKEDAWQKGAVEGCTFVTSKQKCKCPVHMEIRDGNKATNFLMCYGGEAPALAGKLGITKEAAQALLALWRKTNKVINDKLTKLGNDAKMKLEARTLIGRRRLFAKPEWEKARQDAVEKFEKNSKNPMAITSRDISRTYHGKYGNIEREGKNHPIQGTNADIAKIAMGCGFDKNGKPFLWHILREYKARLINFVHDEIVISCPKETAQQCSDAVGDAIVRAGAEVLKLVVMESEGGVRSIWKK